MLRIANRVAFGLLAIVLLAVSAVLGGLVWLRTEWGGEFVRGQIERRVGDLMNGEIHVGDVDGDIVSGIALEDFAMVGDDGVALVRAERVEVAYQLWPFLDQRIVLARVRLRNPEIQLVRDADGRWNFQTLFKPRPPRPPDAPPGWGSFIDIGSIELVEGTIDVRLDEGRWPLFAWSENRFLDVDGEIGLHLDTRRDARRRFDLRDFSFRTTAPELTVERVDGEAVWTPDSVAFRTIEIETGASRVEADGRLVLAAEDSLGIAVDAPRIGLAEWRPFFPAIRLDGEARFRGRVVGDARRPTIEIEAARVETGASTVDVAGSVVAAGSPSLDLELGLDPLAPGDARSYLAAYPFAQPLTGTVSVGGTPESLVLVADLGAPAGSLTAEGTLDLGAGPLRYDVVATSRDLAIGSLVGRPGIDIRLTGAYGIDGRGTGEGDLEARFVGELESSSIYGLDVVSLSTEGEIVGRVYRADSIRARLPTTTLRGSGRFGLASDGVFEADVAVASEDAGEVWPGLDALDGRFQADARIDGTYAAFDIAGEVDAERVAFAGVEADSFAGTAQLDEVTGAMTLTADGTFSGFRAPAGVAARAVETEVRLAGSRMTVDATLEHGYEVTTELGGVADFSGPGTVFELERFAYRTPATAWTMSEGGRLTIGGSRLVADDLEVSQDGQTIRADGVIALDDGTSDLVVTAENVALDEIARVTGADPARWSGRFDLEGRIEGPRAAPRITLSGRAARGAIGGFRFVGLSGSIDYADRSAAVDVVVTTPTEGHEVALQGTVPVDLALVGGVDRIPARPVDLSVVGRGTDLSLVAAVVPGLEDLSGPVDLRVRIGGQPGALRFSGTATLADGRFTIPATGVTYAGIEGEIAFDNEAIRIQRLTGGDETDGRFEIDGRVTFAGDDLELDLSADVTGLHVVDQARQEVVASAEIALTGAYASPRLEGRVVVDEAVYRLPERTKKDVIDLDEAVVYVSVPGLSEELRARPPSFWTRTSLDLLVEVGDQAVITASNARAEIAGDLSLLKPAGQDTPTFSGTLEVRSGYYEEFGQRFTITEGEIFFFGTPQINPGLHIVATRTVPDVEGSEVEIRVVVGGTASNPTIDLESTPAYDRSEIISIALFGSPSASASEQGRYQEAVTGLVLGGAATQLRNALAEEVGLDLDLLEVQQLHDTGSGEAATLFRVGKFITPDVFVTYEQEVGGTDERETVGLRYQVSRMFALQVSAGTEQTGLDLFWEFSY